MSQYSPFNIFNEFIQQMVIVRLLQIEVTWQWAMAIDLCGPGFCYVVGEVEVRQAHVVIIAAKGVCTVS